MRGRRQKSKEWARVYIPSKIVHGPFGHAHNGTVNHWMRKKSKSIVMPSCWHATSTRHSDNTTSTVLLTTTMTTNGHQTLQAHHQHQSQWCVKSCTPTTAFDNGGEMMNGEKWQTGRSINDWGLRCCLSQVLGMFLFCLSFPFFTNLRTMLHAC